MKSIILCEGPDDLLFISYYLFKTSGWTNKGNPQNLWKSYRPKPLNDSQQINYLQKDNNTAIVWCVGGKDSFSTPVSIIIDTFVKEIPSEAVNSIVIVRDRDNDDINAVLHTIESWFPGSPHLENKQPCQHEIVCADGESVSLAITPLVIPFQETGAIETLLMNAIKEQAPCGSIITQAATDYISSLVALSDVCHTYFSRARMILKAKYAATIAVTNPDHSTGLFQDMALACPWENSHYVKEHFDIIEKSITPQT